LQPSGFCLLLVGQATEVLISSHHCFFFREELEDFDVPGWNRDETGLCPGCVGIGAELGACGVRLFRA
jgi:hypothetical protein